MKERVKGVFALILSEANTFVKDAAASAVEATFVVKLEQCPNYWVVQRIVIVVK